MNRSNSSRHIILEAIAEISVEQKAFPVTREQALQVATYAFSYLWQIMREAEQRHYDNAENPMPYEVLKQILKDSRDQELVKHIFRKDPRGWTEEKKTAHAYKMLRGRKKKIDTEGVDD